MKKFSNLQVEQPDRFTGDKIQIYDVINREIIVKSFKIGESNFKDKGNGQRLDLHIEINGTERLLWTGSTILMDQIKQVSADDFPFTTTIIKLNPKGFQFT